VIANRPFHFGLVGRPSSRRRLVVVRGDANKNKKFGSMKRYVSKISRSTQKSKKPLWILRLVQQGLSPYLPVDVGRPIVVAAAAAEPVGVTPAATSFDPSSEEFRRLPLKNRRMMPRRVGFVYRLWVDSDDQKDQECGRMVVAGVVLRPMTAGLL
jgi:hypothetical protein